MQLSVLRKVEGLDDATIEMIAQQTSDKKHIAGIIVATGDEGQTMIFTKDDFEQGARLPANTPLYVDNDYARDDIVSWELLEKTTGFAIATPDGEIVREVPLGDEEDAASVALQRAEKLARGAKISLSVDVEGLEEEEPAPRSRSEARRQAAQRAPERSPERSPAPAFAE